MASAASSSTIQSLPGPGVFHMWIEPLALALASSLPSGLNATPFTVEPACRGAKAGRPVAGFHSETVPF